MKDSEILFAAGCAIISLGITVWYTWTRKKPLEPFLNPNVKKPVTLVRKEIVSHDTRLFRFALDDKEQKLGLPVGFHLFLSAEIDGELIVRPYTPISSEDDKGYFELIIKVYFKNVHPNFPQGGKMTGYLDLMRLGDQIFVRGPSGKLNYSGQGALSIKKFVEGGSGLSTISRKVDRLGMIAGGSGITPMWQVMKAILKDPDDRTTISLIYANKTLSDILLYQELNQLVLEHPGRLSVWYTVESAPEDWEYSVGFICQEMIENHLPPPGLGTMVLLCGPPPMVNIACKPNLERVGFAKDDIFTF